MIRQIFAILLLASANAFTVTPMASRTSMALYDMATEEDTYSPPVTSAGRAVERGVSVDQDGKSNVWAIEPKMEVSSKSSEEKTQSALIAGGGLAAFAVIAGAVLTNLPDPNQF